MLYLRARFERQRRNLTLKQLAALSNLTQGEISLMETGRLIPTDAQRNKLARAFGLSPDDVLKPVESVVNSKAPEPTACEGATEPSAETSGADTTK